MVVRETVKPTDCAFTSQKQTSLPQVLDWGRKAISAAATVQRMLATEAVIRRAMNWLAPEANNDWRAASWPRTVGNIQNNRTADDECNDLHCITYRLELGGLGRAETHVLDDDGRERIDDTIGNGTAFLCQSSRNKNETTTLRQYTYAAKTEVKSKIVLGSIRPLATCFLLKDLFLIPVSLPATRLTAIRRSRGDKKAALVGESGRKNQMTNAQRQVTPPSYRAKEKRREQPIFRPRAISSKGGVTYNVEK
jgi:hypothetical protein